LKDELAEVAKYKEGLREIYEIEDHVRATFFDKKKD
jgi:hypothetical protein